MIFFPTLLISSFITIALIPIVRRLAVRAHAVDLPDTRKVHCQPMPKSGGIAMTLGFMVPVLLWAPRNDFLWALLMGLGVLVLSGLIDDFRNLGYGAKFAGQTAAALVVILYGGLKIRSLGVLFPDGPLLPDWLAIPLTLFVIVGATNAINLSDGLDGLAGGICLLIFCCAAFLALGVDNIVLVCAGAMVGSIFGFLRFNTYPATLFMGDAGSQLLGFTAVSLSLHLTQTNPPLSPLLPLILLGFPILDTLIVMSERISHGRSPFVADKNHFHHKLLRLGLFHTEAVLLIYVLQTFLVTTAFLFRFYSEWFLLIGYLIFASLVVAGFLLAERSRWTLKRYDLLDQTIKSKLRTLKEKYIVIRISFAATYAGFPMIMLFACLLPSGPPRLFSFLTMAVGGLLAAVWFAKKEWTANTLRIAVYLFIPFVIYMSETNVVPWMNGELAKLYNVSFAVLIVFAIFTVKFSRRAKGFKANPLDFLILFIAMVVPAVLGISMRDQHMGVVAAKIIVLFYGYEVIITELRGQLNRLGLATLTALGVITVRGLIS